MDRVQNAYRNMNKLEAVAPSELGAVWPLIRDEVAGIEAPDHFIPEDIYCACKTGESTLFLLSVDGKRIGWMVLRLLGSDLHVWMLKADSGNDVLSLFRAELMNVARAAKATMLTFGTKRRGWDRVAPGHGFQLRQVVYECSVDAS